MDNGTTEYLYSTSKTLTQPTPLWIRLILYLFYIPFFASGIFMLSQAFNFGQNAGKLNTHYVPNVEIADYANSLSDSYTDALREEMTEVVDKTGVPICLMTFELYSVPDIEKFADYDDPEYQATEHFAYEYYVGKYPDEDHWLILYCEDAHNQKNWRFANMLGDNTYNIYTDDILSKFNDRLTFKLASDSYSPSQAFLDGFEYLNDDLLKSNSLGISVKDKDMLPSALFWNIFTIVHFTLMTRNFSTKKYKGYVLQDDGRSATMTDTEKPTTLQDVIQLVKTGNTKAYTEGKCDFCGGTYIKGKDKYCPNCKAIIPYDITESI